MKKKTRGLALFLVLVALGVLAVSAIFPKKDDLNHELSEGFEPIAELSLEKYYFTDIAVIDEPAKVLGLDIPFAHKKVIFTYEGSVKAGIDNFEAIEVAVNQKSQTITLRAPDVRLLETKIDPSSVRVYDQSMNPFNQLKVEDITGLLASKEQEAKDKALESGLLDRARDRAKSLLLSQVQSLVTGTSLEGYKVELEWQG
ncbi:DUF4230 domain-containing protein [Rothia sp. CCM 9417]|uniref:DUF4230 domain-containing protein n=1 Tax=unclassified Rothia (in: high G+C Gram-positive bacteria) TaxID=2689056 RepID=UPI003AC53DB2